jgi:hypothetical protein
MVYRLSLVVFDARAGSTEIISLARYEGSPADADAPLWTRRLRPGKLLRFSQPRAFGAQLVAGISDIRLYVSSSYRSYNYSHFYRLPLGMIRDLHPPRRSLGHATLPYFFSLL